MKSIIQLSLLATAFLLSSVKTIAQNSESSELSLDSGTIESQFEYIFRKSGNFKGTNGQPYEAVKFSSLVKLKGNVLDSLETTYNKLNNSEKTVNTQANEIDELKSQLAQTQTTLDQTNTEKNNMAFVGMQTSKTNYNVIMWSIVAGLLALLFLFIYKFKNSNAVTKSAKFKLDELELEFEEHRRNALEREQKVRRQLQDEINKQKS